MVSREFSETSLNSIFKKALDKKPSTIGSANFTLSKFQRLIVIKHMFKEKLKHNKNRFQFLMFSNVFENIQLAVCITASEYTFADQDL